MKKITFTLILSQLLCIYAVEARTYLDLHANKFDNKLTSEEASFIKEQMLGFYEIDTDHFNSLNDSRFIHNFEKLSPAFTPCKQARYEGNVLKISFKKESLFNSSLELNYSYNYLSFPYKSEPIIRTVADSDSMSLRSVYADHAFNEYSVSKNEVSVKKGQYRLALGFFIYPSTDSFLSIQLLKEGAIRIHKKEGSFDASKCVYRPISEERYKELKQKVLDYSTNN